MPSFAEKFFTYTLPTKDPAAELAYLSKLYQASGQAPLYFESWVDQQSQDLKDAWLKKESINLKKIRKFKASYERENSWTQIETVAHAIQSWAKDNGLDAGRVANWDTFLSKLQGEAYVPPQDIPQWFSAGKRALEQIYLLITHSPSIPLHQKQHVIRQLSSNGSLVDACSPGVLSRIKDTPLELLTDWSSQLMNARLKIVQSCAQDHIRKRGLCEEMWEIHYVNAFRNYVAGTVQIPSETDILAPQTLSFDDLSTFKEEVMTTINISTVANKVTQVLLERCGDFSFRNIEPLNELEKELNLLGQDPNCVDLSSWLFEEDDTNKDGYKKRSLAEIEFIIQCTLITRLNDQGYLEKETLIPIELDENYQFIFVSAELDTSWIKSRKENLPPEPLWKFLKKKPEYRELVKKHFEIILNEKSNVLSHSALFSVREYLIWSSCKITPEDINQTDSIDKFLAIISKLSEDQKKELFCLPTIKNKLHSWIKGSGCWAEILLLLPENVRLLFLRNTIDQLQSSTFSYCDFIDILHLLPETQHATFLELPCIKDKSLADSFYITRGIPNWLAKNAILPFLRIMEDKLRYRMLEHPGFINILKRLPKTQQAKFLALANIDYKKFLNTQNLKSILEFLESNIRLFCLQNMQIDYLNMLFVDFINILKLLPETQRAAFLTMPQIKEKLRQIHWRDIKDILDCLAAGDCLPFLQDMQDKLSDVDPNDFINYLQSLPETKRAKFLAPPLIKDKLRLLIKNPLCITNILKLFAPDDRLPFLRSVENLSDVTFSRSQFIDTLKLLPETQRAAFLTMPQIKEKLRQIHWRDIKDILDCLAAGDCLPFLQDMQDKLSDVDPNDFINYLQSLPETKRAKFLAPPLIKDKLRLLIKNPLCITNILKLFAPDDRLPFLRSVENLSDVTFSRSQFIDTLKLLPEIQHAEFLALVDIKETLNAPDDLTVILRRLPIKTSSLLLQKLEDTYSNYIKSRDVTIINEALNRIFKQLPKEKAGSQKLLHEKGLQTIVFQGDINSLLATHTALTPNEQQYLAHSISLRKTIEQSIDQLEAKGNSLQTKDPKKHTAALDLVRQLREETYNHFVHADLSNKTAAEAYVKRCVTAAQSDKESINAYREESGFGEIINRILISIATVLSGFTLLAVPTVRYTFFGMTETQGITDAVLEEIKNTKVACMA